MPKKHSSLDRRKSQIIEEEQVLSEPRRRFHTDGLEVLTFVPPILRAEAVRGEAVA